MSLVSLNPSANQVNTTERDVLSVFKSVPDKPNEIKKGMSPNQIAEIVSDHFIGVVKQQFETAKQNYQSQSINK